MLIAPLPVFGQFSLGKATNAVGGTAFTKLIPPWVGPPGAAAMIYGLNANNTPNWTGPSGGVTHITRALYTTPSTQHNVYLMRPLNWTTFSVAVAKNATAITLAADPGVYSTNYKYSLPAGQTGPCVADNAIAANDYVAYQLADGTWVLDTIASGTFGGGNLVLTTGTPNVNGATIAASSPLFFFGIKTDTDPATGGAHWTTLTTASTNRQDIFQQDNTVGGFTALHPGDPIAFLSDNATAQGWLDLMAGYYGKM